MTQTTMIIDAETAKVLNELKDSFGVKTNSAVIRRALALARVATKDSADDTVVFLDKDNNKKHVVIR